MKPRFKIEQKITPFVNKYAIYAVDEAGEKTSLIALAQQKRIALKEKITFYNDEAKTAEVFSFQAEKVMDIHGKYFVLDPAGAQIGAFKKAFGKSLLNSTWYILDAQDQPKITISESNMALAIIRRFAGFIPIVGGIFEIVTHFLKYHFVFADAANQPVGKYQKTTLFRDRYLLSMTDQAYQGTDWRVIAAMAVALDALQSR